MARMYSGRLDKKNRTVGHRIGRYSVKVHRYNLAGYWAGSQGDREQGPIPICNTLLILTAGHAMAECQEILFDIASYSCWVARLPSSSPRKRQQKSFFFLPKPIQPRDNQHSLLEKTYTNSQICEMHPSIQVVFPSTESEHALISAALRVLRDVRSIQVVSSPHATLDSLLRS